MLNIIGYKYNKLLVLSEVPKKNYNKRRVSCICDCGNLHEVDMIELRKGSIKSCGCLRSLPSNKTHGLTGDRIYKVHSNMLTRCKNKNSKDFKNYGGRGISICDNWLSFEGFYGWVLISGYSDGLTIDRINNNKGYFPENCRWTDRTTQCRNRRKFTGSSSKYIGVSLLRNEWISRVRVNKKIIYLGSFEFEIDAAIARDNYIIDNYLKGFTMNDLPKCSEFKYRER